MLLESLVGEFAGGDGDGGGGFAHRNRCLRVKASFAARAAILAPVVWWGGGREG